MALDRETIRECCTEAVFERGQTYREEGRIRQLDRFGDTVTARVQGTELYETRVHLDSDEFDPHCTCPYTGPGECKHVVAVLLAVADDVPDDESGRIDDLLADVSTEGIRTFVREELTRNPEMRERFLAEFGDEPTVTPEEYRQEVDRLFDQHTKEYPVVTGAIDFSQLTDLAERYRENGNYEQAAAVYRGLSEGIAENMNLVDGAYDHYSQTFHSDYCGYFHAGCRKMLAQRLSAPMWLTLAVKTRSNHYQSALDGYVECLATADLDDATVEEHAEYLETRVGEAVDYLARRYEKALDDLESGE